MGETMVKQVLVYIKHNKGATTAQLYKRFPGVKILYLEFQKLIAYNKQDWKWRIAPPPVEETT